MSSENRISAAASQGTLRVMPTPAEIAEIERQARAMRGEAISQMFRSARDSISRALWRAQQREYASFLARATDHADLERRMKSLNQIPRPLAG
ncbi:MAG: RSP_7527 family protein [Burkholderiales bacterium]